MASGAGAASAAGMLQVEVIVHRYIQQRFGLSVVLIGQLTGLKLKRHVRR